MSEIKQLSMGVKYKSDWRIECLRCEKDQDTNVTGVEWSNKDKSITIQYKCSCGWLGGKELKLEHSLCKKS